MSEAYIAILQGKRRSGTFTMYNLPFETGQLIEEYVRHYPKLSMNQEYAYSKYEEQMKEQSSEIGVLRSEIDELKNMVFELLNEPDLAAQVKKRLKK
jgi:hypothetical protein